MGEGNSTGVVTEDQRTVAETVVQWLGTEVGCVFLDRVAERVAKEYAGKEYE